MESRETTQNQPDLDVQLFDNFATASKAVLNHLHSRLGFDLWMMTRTDSDDWIVLQALDNGYNVTEGMVFPWADSFCSRMVLGEGPQMAPRSKDVPAYASAPIAGYVPIEAYVGVPVLNRDGSLFGTLCAIDRVPHEDSIKEELPLIKLFAQLLGSMLSNELHSIEQARQLEKSHRLAHTDPQTSLLNRRGWELGVETEESRARRYGTPISAFIVDLDELKLVNDTQGHHRGDELIQRTAKALKAAVRSGDLVARIGGDEFGILAIECGKKESKQVLENIQNALSENGINASVGYSVRHPAEGLRAAIKQADLAMYQCKHRYRQESPRAEMAL